MFSRVAKFSFITWRYSTCFSSHAKFPISFSLTFWFCFCKRCHWKLIDLLARGDLYCYHEGILSCNSQFLTQEKESCQCIVVYLKMDPIFEALLPENTNLIPTLRHMFLPWKFKWPVHNWLSLHADNCLPISIILNVNLPKSVFYTSNRHPSGYTIDK